ncbi:phosphopantetheine-binding protein [Akkermansiaceae bacterium]|nr:phosphopantetheine-binding protein [Akkermansiaceae bacterium]
MKITISELIKIGKIASDDDEFDIASGDISFKLLGLDSLDLSAFFLAIEDEYGVGIPDEEFDKITSPNDLIAYLADK